jgi:hypothetical protein
LENQKRQKVEIMTMSVHDVLVEMREMADAEGLNELDILRWANTLEAAMREPVGELTEKRMGEIKFQQLRDCEAGPLYALPPDAAYWQEEARRFAENAEHWRQETRWRDTEIERLTEALRMIQCACIMPRPGVVGAVQEIARAALAKENKI